MFAFVYVSPNPWLSRENELILGRYWKLVFFTTFISEVLNYLSLSNNWRCTRLKRIFFLHSKNELILKYTEGKPLVRGQQVCYFLYNFYLNQLSATSLACENSRFSSLFAAEDVSRGITCVPPVVSSLPSLIWLAIIKTKGLTSRNRFAARVRRCYFSEGEKRRPEIRLLFAGYAFPHRTCFALHARLALAFARIKNAKKITLVLQCKACRVPGTK